MLNKFPEKNCSIQKQSKRHYRFTPITISDIGNICNVTYKWERKASIPS